MSQTIRFHLDENVSNAIADALRRRNIDATTTSEVGLIGASDFEQIQFAFNQDRVIFTLDDDFLVLHQQGIEHAGIIYCNQNRRSIGEMIRGLILIWEVLNREEMQNHLEFI